MTREENIRAILETCFSGFKEELVDIAVDRIISLEQQPCEDAVSRQQAISSIRNLYPGRPFVKLNLKKWQEKNKKYFECENIIKALPSVTPTRIETVTEFADRCRECGKQKKGKWIKNSWEICYTCTRCWKTNPSGTKYPYCPNCGAEMESEDNGND